MYDQEGKTLTIDFSRIFVENLRYLRKNLRKTVFKPFGKMVCMRMILFYQKHLSRHDCKYRPTCSQYTLECINNHGAIIGIILGAFRILRCHPWCKGGYDPAPEQYWKKRWLL